MGGSIRVANRYSDGSIWSNTVHTNYLPIHTRGLALTADADAHLREYVAAVNEPPEQPIAPHGYGLIVYDVANKLILSMQGYSALTQIHSLGQHQGDETIAQARTLHDRGLLAMRETRVVVDSDPPDRTSTIRPSLGLNRDFDDLVKAYTATREMEFRDTSIFSRFDLVADLAPWVVENFSEDSAGAEAFHARLGALGFVFTPKEEAAWHRWVLRKRHEAWENSESNEPAPPLPDMDDD